MHRKITGYFIINQLVTLSIACILITAMVGLLGHTMVFYVDSRQKLNAVTNRNLLQKSVELDLRNRSYNDLVLGWDYFTIYNIEYKVLRSSNGYAISKRAPDLLVSTRYQELIDGVESYEFKKDRNSKYLTFKFNGIAPLKFKVNKKHELNNEHEV